MHVDKAEIIATLRARGLHARADWVDRTLPSAVDTYENEALLQMLKIDPAAMTPVDAASPQGGGP
ncbi:MAG TPA: hypothetical protein VGJ95_15935 [Pseudonocardiaceae bacterium]|jgi:hypothetical protein